MLQTKATPEPLIAAAPELVDLLRAIVKTGTGPQGQLGGVDKREIDAARALLARLDGGGK